MVVSIVVLLLLLLVSRAAMSELLVASLQVRQLDATISSLKQHKLQSHSSLLKALEQENVALKQELEAQRELAKVCTECIGADNQQLSATCCGICSHSLLFFGVFQGCEAGQGHSELELLQQENEALKAQMARLSTQLLDVSCDTNRCVKRGASVLTWKAAAGFKPESTKSQPKNEKN